MKRLIIIAALAAASAAAQEPKPAPEPKPDETWKCYALTDFNHRNVLVTATVKFAETKPQVRAAGGEAARIEVAGTTYLAIFTRQGFERRWDFGGDDGFSYALVVKPEGRAQYYDFTAEERVKPSGIYDCVQPRGERP